jgi:hypothetical protein
MHTIQLRQRFTAVLGALIVLSLLAIPATANHSWGRYHWEDKTPTDLSDPVPLTVNKNTDWPEFARAFADWDTTGDGWTAPARIDLRDGSSRLGACGATSGQITVCNDNYGDNGWLGIAQIWATKNHIYQATAKMNDWYFEESPDERDINDVTWYQRNFPNDWQAVLAADRKNVMCQEIGHTFGLDHQDENFSNTDLDTCMDYVWDPRGDEYPNFHDYEQLATIYNHSETAKAPRGKGSALGNSASDWGQVIAHDAQGRPSEFRKILDAAAEDEVITHVIWARSDQAPAVNDGNGDGGKNDGGKQDGGKNDGGKKADGKRDGDKQRQGDRDRHRHR